MGRDINEIYDDTVVKYTLNIPKELYYKVAILTAKGTKYGGRKSVFLRELIENAVTDERLPTPKEYKELSAGRAYEPPKRYSGFIGGLLRNSYRWIWFRKKYLDKKHVW